MDVWTTDGRIKVKTLLIELNISQINIKVKALLIERRYRILEEESNDEKENDGMDNQLHKFPVLLEETNEVLTLFLTKSDMEKANQGYINILLYLDLFNV